MTRSTWTANNKLLVTVNLAKYAVVHVDDKNYHVVMVDLGYNDVDYVDYE